MSGMAHIDATNIPDRFCNLMDEFCRVAGDVSLMIARGPLADDLAQEVGSNADGDNQKALDVIADSMFFDACMNADVRFYASEEQDAVVAANATGSLAVAIDPLDGSSNIDVNVSIGTIFSVYDAAEDATASFLRPVGEQVAAGYFIYGPQTALMATFGAGTFLFILDPLDRKFRIVNDSVAVPGQSREFAINASNYRHWSKPIRAYIDDCLAGEEGPRAQNYNMRWVASLVAETHRIISRGGIFLYPSDDREGYTHGRLRLLYECAPIAMLVEQAGGKATDGCEPILSKTASDLHGRTPFVFGSAEKVSRVAAYHDLPDDENSALFGTRGLFRA